MTSAAEAPDLSGLIELSRKRRVDMKPMVLRVQTDLFLAAPIRDREVLEGFAALVSGLIPTVDADTVLAVALKLAPCPDTPRIVLQRLVERGAATAEAVLVAAPKLDAELIAGARAVGADVESALMKRPPAPPETIEEAEPLDLPAQITAARRNSEAAQKLLARADIAPTDLAPLWLHADMPTRSLIREAVESVAALRSCPPPPRDLAPILVSASQRQDVAGVLGPLAESLHLPSDFIGSAPDATTRYDLLTLALRAVDLPEHDAIFIFLSLNETVARSVHRVFELVELFRTTSRPAARELLSAILDRPLPERGGTAAHRAYFAAEPASARKSQAIERIAVRPAAQRRSGRTTG